MIKEIIPAGKKQKFDKTHQNIKGEIKNLHKKQIVLRLDSKLNETTEYSLRYEKSSKNSSS